MRPDAPLGSLVGEEVFGKLETEIRRMAVAHPGRWRSERVGQKIMGDSGMRNMNSERPTTNQALAPSCF